jgi:hypothetical protein
MLNALNLSSLGLGINRLLDDMYPRAANNAYHLVRITLFSIPTREMQIVLLKDLAAAMLSSSDELSSDRVREKPETFTMRFADCC